MELDAADGWCTCRDRSAARETLALRIRIVSSLIRATIGSRAEWSTSTICRRAAVAKGSVRPSAAPRRTYPAGPPTVEEIVAVRRRAGDRTTGLRTGALIILLWRAGLRISEAVALAASDLDPQRTLCDLVETAGRLPRSARVRAGPGTQAERRLGDEQQPGVGVWSERTRVAV